MGGACGKASKDAAKYRRASIRPGTESAYKTGPLSRKAIVQRLSVVDAKETEYGPGFKICYAAVSQRGYYPEALNKANQDSYLIQPTGMGNMKGKGLFGVFDGHGPKGHLCSGFVKEKLPGNMQMFCTADPSTKYKEFLRGFSNAFTETNIQMHENVDINDKMSGTTAIVAFVDGCTVYTANIGDSRAIIAYNQDGKLRVAALSMDQTPFRYDERERVKRAGARVMTMDQIEGSEPIHENWGLNLGDEIDSEGNPPRIWSQVGNYPGCAFTRSLGDQVAETLGVYAEPEILRRDIRPTDKFIILASDGVFEFLTSQAVAELGDQFEHPVEACRSICAEAYRMWMTYEVRTDDITVVMLQFKIDAEYFDVAQLPAMDSQSPGHALRVLRPVRRGLSKAKRKAIMGRRMTANDGREGKFVVSEHVVDKTEEQADEIRAAIRANFLFAHMNAKQIEDVVRMMEPETVAAGEVLIHQGSSGDFLYMVEHGNFDVYVKKGPSEEQGPEGDGPHAALGTLVHTYISSSEVHPVFGELALMYAKPRAASVVAQTDGKLWRLKRRAFRHIVMKSAHEDLHKTLKKVAVLSGLNKNELQRLADVMAEVSFAKDEPIVKQGDVGDTMFVIKEGSVVCRIEDRDDDGNVQIKDVLTLGANDYFGERAILHDEPRAASVIATKNGTVCFEISRKLFEEVLGSLDAIINEDRKQREKKGMERAQNFKRRIYIEEGGSKTDSFSFSSQNLELSGIEQLLPLGKVADVDDVKVFLCQYKINSVRMTVKVVSKSDVLKQGTEDNVVREKELLAALSCTPTVDSPCLPRLVATYHVGAQLCMLLDAQCICSLASLLEDSLFSENDAKFAAMLLLQALRQLHRPGDLTSPRKAMRRVARGQTGRGNGGGGSGGSGGGRGAATKLEGVMLRGLTPEHVMIDAQGYPCICDFRLAKRLGHDDATYTLCGTPEYLAPEIIGGQGHSFAVDYWAMGVLIFEMTSGKTPFRETETSPELQIYARATNHKKNSHHLEFPENASMELQVLVRNLLDPDADARMNYGLEATSSSSWFESLGDFERLRKKAANSPYLEALRPKARKMNASGEQNQLFDDRHTATQPEGEDWSVFDDF